MDNVNPVETPQVEGTTEAVSQTVEETAVSTTPPKDEATASPAEPDGAEPTGREAQVPYKRFKDVNSKKKALEEENAKLKAALQSAAIPRTTTPPVPEGIDPKVAEQLKPYMDYLAQQGGYVKKEELQRKEAVQREHQALESLASRYPGKSGEPVFDKEQVMDAVQDILSNPESFYESVYLLLNKDNFADYAAKQAKRQRVAPATESKPSEKKVGVSSEDDIKKAQKTGSFKEVFKNVLFGQEI